jgi:hypothetical protein
LLPSLDEWLASVFAPERVDETVAALLSAPDEDEAAAARVDAARHALENCASPPRATGTIDARVVAAWIAEVESARASPPGGVLAEHDAARSDAAAQRAMIASVDVRAMLEAQTQPTRRGNLRGPRPHADVQPVRSTRARRVLGRCT